MFSIAELQLLYNSVSSSIKEEFELVKLGKSTNLEELLLLRAKIQSLSKNFVLDKMEEDFRNSWKESKLETIKKLRNITGLSLMDCKWLLEGKFGK